MKQMLSSLRCGKRLHECASLWRSSDLLETEVDYDEEAAESLFELFQEMECSIESIYVDPQITCPRGKTRTSSNERLVVCSNSSCQATFRSEVKV